MPKFIVRIVAFMLIPCLLWSDFGSRISDFGLKSETPSPASEILASQALAGRALLMQRLTGAWRSRHEISTERFKIAGEGRVRFNPKIRDIYESDDLSTVISLYSADQQLGDPYSDAKGFIRLLEKLPHLRQLIVHGDLVHKTHHYLDQTEQQSSDSEKVLPYLRRRVRAGLSGIRLPGNHDYHIKERAAVREVVNGIQLASWEILEHDGVRVLVVHGDEHDGIKRGPEIDSSAPGKRWYALVRGIDYVLRWVSDRLRLPFAIPVLRLFRLLHLEIQDYEKRFIQTVVQLAKEHKADIVVTGHLHMPKPLLVEGVLYCNTGAWSEPEPVVVAEHADGSWELLRWHAGNRPALRRVASVVRMSPGRLMEKISTRFMADVKPPAPIVPRRSEYVPGPRIYMKLKWIDHFRNYLAGTSQKLSEDGVVVLNSFLKHVADLKLMPRVVEEIIYEFIHAAIGDWNPLRGLKAIGCQAALEELPRLDERIAAHSEERNHAKEAIAVAVDGNRIGSSLFRTLTRGGLQAFRNHFDSVRLNPLVWTTDHRDRLLDDLNGGPKNVLYILDNVVEDVCLLPLVEWLLKQGHTVTLAAKAREADNDVTVDDMNSLLENPAVAKRFSAYRQSGHLKVITNGSASRGVDLRRATPELVRAWQHADVILVSGEGARGTLDTPGKLTKGFYSLMFAKNSDESNIPLNTGVVEWIPAARAAGSHPNARDEYFRALVEDRLNIPVRITATHTMGFELKFRRDHQLPLGQEPPYLEVPEGMANLPPRANAVFTVMEALLDHPHPEQVKDQVQELLRRMDRQWLPDLLRSGDGLALSLERMEDALVLPVMSYLPDKVFRRRIKALAIYSPCSAALFLGYAAPYDLLQGVPVLHKADEHTIGMLIAGVLHGAEELRQQVGGRPATADEWRLFHRYQVALLHGLLAHNTDLETFKAKIHTHILRHVGHLGHQRVEDTIAAIDRTLGDPRAGPLPVEVPDYIRTTFYLMGDRTVLGLMNDNEQNPNSPTKLWDVTEGTVRTEVQNRAFTSGESHHFFQKGQIKKDDLQLMYEFITERVPRSADLGQQSLIVATSVRHIVPPTAKLEQDPDVPAAAEPPPTAEPVRRKAATPKQTPWFPILLERMGFKRLEDVITDPTFLNLAKKELCQSDQLAVSFSDWANGRPVDPSRAKLFAPFVLAKTRVYSLPLTSTVVEGTLEKIATCLHMQFRDEESQMIQKPGSFRILADPDTRWKRILIFEVLNFGKDPSKTIYLPWGRIGSLPVYIVQIQIQEFDSQHPLKTLKYALDISSWRAMGYSTEDAEEEVQFGHTPKLGMLKDVDPSPSSPGMSYEIHKQVSNKPPTKKKSGTKKAKQPFAASQADAATPDLKTLPARTKDVYGNRGPAVPLRDEEGSSMDLEELARQIQTFGGDSLYCRVKAADVEGLKRLLPPGRVVWGMDVQRFPFADIVLSRLSKEGPFVARLQDDAVRFWHHNDQSGHVTARPGEQVILARALERAVRAMTKLESIDQLPDDKREKIRQLTVEIRRQHDWYEEAHPAAQTIVLHESLFRHEDALVGCLMEGLGHIFISEPDSVESIADNLENFARDVGMDAFWSALKFLGVFKPEYKVPDYGSNWLSVQYAVEMGQLVMRIATDLMAAKAGSEHLYTFPARPPSGGPTRRELFALAFAALSGSKALPTISALPILGEPVMQKAALLKTESRGFGWLLHIGAMDVPVSLKQEPTHDSKKGDAENPNLSNVNYDLLLKTIRTPTMQLIKILHAAIDRGLFVSPPSHDLDLAERQAA